MSASLYELSSTYLEALDMFTDPDQDIDQQTIIDTLESLDDELDSKLINVGKFILSLENQADGIAQAEKRMGDRRKALANKADWLRDYMKSQMERTGKTKLSSPDISLSLAKLPPSVIIDNEDIIPFEFLRSKIEPNKSLIKAAGGCPGARVESVGFRVSIK